jgi:hypothetical protein
MQEEWTSDNSESINELERKSRNKEVRREVFVKILGVISFIGFALSVFFLTGITGSVIGKAKENVAGAMFVVILFLIWLVAVFLWSNLRKK